MKRLSASALVALFAACAAPRLCGEDDKLLLPWSGDRTITLHLKYTLTAEPGAERIVFKTQLPDTIAGRQKVLAVRYTHKPLRVYKLGEGRYAEWRFDSLKEPLTIGIDLKASTWRYDLGTALNKPSKRTPVRKPDGRWLKPEPLLESNHDEIAAAAREIRGANRAELVRGILDAVANHMDIGGYDVIDRGAAWAWNKRTGDCSEYADLFIALCRARGIPARFCAGYATHLGSSYTMKHGWAEVFFPKLGWVPFDPILFDSGDASLHALPNGYLLLGHQRRNRELYGFQFMAYSARKGRLGVKEALSMTRHDIEE